MQTSPSAFAYVADASAAAALYAKLFGAEPVQASPDFAMFAFPNGTSFGVWGRARCQSEGRDQRRRRCRVRLRSGQRC